MEYILDNGIPFQIHGTAGKNISGNHGTMSGIFVGCLAVALAEALNGTAIFARRAKLQMGLSFTVLSVAVGKVLASLLQFYNDWVN